MDLPTLNATLNACAMALMAAAFVAIKTKRRQLHRNLMLAAVVASAAFLVSYLTYHFGYEAKTYAGSYPYWYYSMLVPHIILAALVPFGVIYVVVKGLRGDYINHKKIARWTLPVWAYVSVTGIMIYFMVHV